MDLHFEDGEVPFEINGTERDSNLLPEKMKAQLPADIQDKLNEYNRNFEALNSYLGDDSLIEAGVATEMRVEKTREMLVQALPVAVRTVVEIANYSLSDSIRLKAAMYIIDKTTGKENIVAEDSATALLRKLTSGTEGG